MSLVTRTFVIRIGHYVLNDILPVMQCFHTRKFSTIRQVDKGQVTISLMKGSPANHHLHYVMGGNLTLINLFDTKFSFFISH